MGGRGESERVMGGRGEGERVMGGPGEGERVMGVLAMSADSSHSLVLNHFTYPQSTSLTAGL